MATRDRIRMGGLLSATLLGTLLAFPLRAQTIRGEDLVRYLQPGSWDIEILFDTSRMTVEERKKLEGHAGAQSVHSTDCLDAHGKSRTMAEIEGDSKEAAKESENHGCKSTLTPTGAHEARIVTSCSYQGKVVEMVMTCRYTTFEVTRKGADGRDFVFKKGRRTGDCK